MSDKINALDVTEAAITGSVMQTVTLNDAVAMYLKRLNDLNDPKDPSISSLLVLRNGLVKGLAIAQASVPHEIAYLDTAAKISALIADPDRKRRVIPGVAADEEEEEDLSIEEMEARARINSTKRDRIDSKLPRLIVLDEYKLKKYKASIASDFYGEGKHLYALVLVYAGDPEKQQDEYLEASTIAATGNGEIVKRIKSGTPVVRVRYAYTDFTHGKKSTFVLTVDELMDLTNPRTIASVVAANPAPVTPIVRREQPKRTYKAKREEGEVILNVDPATFVTSRHVEGRYEKGEDVFECMNTSPHPASSCHFVHTTTMPNTYFSVDSKLYKANDLMKTSCLDFLRSGERGQSRICHRDNCTFGTACAFVHLKAGAQGIEHHQRSRKNDSSDSQLMTLDEATAAQRKKLYKPDGAAAAAFEDTE